MIFFILMTLISFSIWQLAKAMADIEAKREEAGGQTKHVNESKRGSGLRNAVHVDSHTLAT